MMSVNIKYFLIMLIIAFLGLAIFIAILKLVEKHGQK
jgi:hypothetical protein